MVSLFGSEEATSKVSHIRGSFDQFPGTKAANDDTNFPGRLSSNYLKHIFKKKVVNLFWYFGSKIKDEFKDLYLKKVNY